MEIEIFELERRQLEAEIAALDEKLEAERQKLKNDLAKERKVFELEKKTVADAEARTKTFVKLNVGGTIYHTSRTTLLSKKGSMLEVLFSGRHTVPKDDDGNYFLDRDPMTFAYVLTLLFGGSIS